MAVVYTCMARVKSHADRLRPSRAAEAYTSIRRAILDLELPPAAPLSEAQLAEAIGMSRTPVREALKILASEGLVRSFPARGTFVAELSSTDVAEIYEVRTLLEPFAASVAASQISDAEITALQESLGRAEAAIAEARIDEACLLDIRLHTSIVSVTRNRRIKQILAQLDDQVHRIRLLAFQDTTRMLRTVEEHRRIIDTLVARDATAAESAMRAHLTAARKNALMISLRLHPDGNLDFESFANR